MIALLVSIAAQGAAAAPAPARLSSLEQRAGWIQAWDGRSLAGWRVVRDPQAAPDARAPEILDGWLVASTSSGVSLCLDEPRGGCELRCAYRDWNDPHVRCDELHVRVEGRMHPPREVPVLDWIRVQGFPFSPWTLRDPAANRLLWELALEPGFRRHALRDVFLRDLEHLPGRDVELFDGSTLAHWHPIGTASYRVDQHSILARTGTGKANAFLVSDESFGDFLFELDLRNEEQGNSGIQIRSRVVGELQPSAWAAGYQIEIDPSPRAWSGGLYEERGRGWLHTLERDDEARRAFVRGEWNHYRIECLGPWIRAWINDVPTTDVFDGDALEGVLGLQVHAGQSTRVRFKNLRLHAFGRSAWRALDAADFAARGAELGRDFSLRLVRAAGAELASLRLAWRGSASESARMLALDDARLAPARSWAPWSELELHAYGSRLVVLRDREQVLDERGPPGGDGARVWIQGPAPRADAPRFSRVETLVALEH